MVGRVQRNFAPGLGSCIRCGASLWSPMSPASAREQHGTGGWPAKSNIRDVDGRVRYLAGIAVAPGYKEVTGYLTGVTRQRRRRSDPNFIATALRERRFRLCTGPNVAGPLPSSERAEDTLRNYYRCAQASTCTARSRWSAGQDAPRVLLSCSSVGTTAFSSARGPAFVEVDGQPVGNGESISLQAGRHSLSIGSAEQGVSFGFFLTPGSTQSLQASRSISRSSKDRKASRVATSATIVGSRASTSVTSRDDPPQTAHRSSPEGTQGP